MLDPHPSHLAIRRIAVILPARDEEATIDTSIRAIRRAAALVPHVETEIVVVANGCKDDTVSTARELGVRVLTTSVPNVGAARALGASLALRQPADGLWLATTDADSLVPANWLEEQLRAAADGFDVFLGTVALAPEDAARHQGWAAAYALRATLDPNHGHVHGANLGVRATSYVRAGGFRPLPAHEDVDLVSRLRAVDARITWVSHVPVLTSARHDPRAIDGVGSDLAASG